MTAGSTLEAVTASHAQLPANVASCAVESLRPRLVRLAYQLVSSAPEAEDVVQEALLRWHQARPGQIEQPWPWLAKVVCRISVDRLRSARYRRERLVGTRLPEPPVVLDTAGDPAEQVVHDEAIGTAVLVVLESLTPAQRVVFVLHEVFEWPFTAIAEVVDRTPQACRQLATRARTKVGAESPRVPVDADEHRAVVSAFRLACARGDFETLLNLLDSDVVVRTDGGAFTSARRPVHGAERAATYLSRVLAKWAVELRPATVGGAPGVVVQCDRKTVAVVSVVVRNSVVRNLDILMDPAKLAHVPHAMPIEERTVRLVSGRASRRPTGRR